MNFIILALVGMYFYDKYKLKNKRKNRIIQTINMLIKNELKMVHSLDKKVETYEYGDKDLYLNIYKKRDTIFIRAYIRNIFGDEKLIYSSEYDLMFKEWKKDKWDYEHLDRWWNTRETSDMQEIGKLKKYLLETADKHFGMSLKMSNPEMVNERETTAPLLRKEKAEENKTTEDSLLKHLHELLTKGNLSWKEENGVETYFTNYKIPGTTNWKITNKKEDGLQSISIEKDGSIIINLEYTPDNKEVKSLNINKSWIHKIDDMDNFTFHLQGILYYMFDKGMEKQDIIMKKLQHLQKQNQGFQEKEHKVEELIAYIEKHKEDLELEDVHLFTKIKEEKLKEVTEMRNKLPQQPEYEQDMEGLMDILVELLQGIQTKINQLHSKKAALEERLLQNLKDEYHQE